MILTLYMINLTPNQFKVHTVTLPKAVKEVLSLYVKELTNRITPSEDVLYIWTQKIADDKLRLVIFSECNELADFVNCDKSYDYIAHFSDYKIYISSGVENFFRVDKNSVIETIPKNCSDSPIIAYDAAQWEISLKDGCVVNFSYRYCEISEESATKVRAMKNFPAVKFEYTAPIIQKNRLNVINGNVRGYNTEIAPWPPIGVTVCKSPYGRFLAGDTTDLGNNFCLDSILNGTVNVRFFLWGFYETIIKNIELNNDTIELKDIPMFRMSDCYESEQRELKITQQEKWQFPENNKIYFNCGDSKEDSILFELNRKSNSIEINYERIKSCDNMGPNPARPFK